MKYNREIERKYTITSGYEAAKWRLGVLYSNPVKVYEGVSTDTFWSQKNTDFIRLRKNTSELSVKITDKITIEDRVEENIVVEDFDTAYRFSTAVFGEPVGTLEKTYYVLELTQGVILALYTVKGYSKVFLEVEAPSISQVIDTAHRLSDVFEMEQEMRSLFQIIFGGNNV